MSDRYLLPFTIDVAGTPLCCHRALRVLPGQRLVCTGLWRGRAVVAKLYLHPQRRKRHGRREERGLRALAARQLNAPTLLYAGPLANGDWAVICERIFPALTLLQAWTQADRDLRRRLLSRLIATVAAQHDQGVHQRDLHFGNFLLTGTTLCALDGAEFSIGWGALGQRQGLANLGLLLAQLPPDDTALIEPALAEYCTYRRYDPDQARPLLYQALEQAQQYRERKYLQKIFRNCTAFASGGGDGCYWVLDRRYDSPALRTLLATPGEGVGVRPVQIEGQTFTLRAYPPTWAFSRTPAARAWREAHHRHWCGLAGPLPVALLEEPVGRWRRRGVLIVLESSPSATPLP